MKLRFFSTLIDGPARYRPETGWGPAVAILAVIAIVGLSSLTAVLVASLLPGSEPDAATAMQSFEDQVLLVVQQATMVGLTIAAAFMFASTPRDALALRPVPKGSLAPSFVIQLVVSLAYTALVFAIAKDAILNDLMPFIAALRGEHWVLLSLAVAVGAPLSEEFLFRGFLLSALAKTPLGFLGAALVSNAAWTTLHMSYSVYGLIDVFLVGLVLSWLLWRTGSLWVTIICHGLYNSLILAGIFLANNNGWLPAVQIATGRG